MIYVKVGINQDKLKRFLGAVTDLCEAEISKALWTGGKQTVSIIKQQSKEPKTGNKGFIYKNGKRYIITRSSANETSARNTGRKNNATNFIVNRKTLQIGITNAAPYGVFVELGTKKMGARRDLQVGIDKNKMSIIADAEVRIKKIFDNNLK